MSGEILTAEGMLPSKETLTDLFVCGRYSDEQLTTEGKSKSSSGVVRLSHDPGCYKHKILITEDMLPSKETVTKLFVCHVTMGTTQVCC